MHVLGTILMQPLLDILHGIMATQILQNYSIDWWFKVSFLYHLVHDSVICEQ